MQTLIDEIAEAVKPEFGKGKVADYIPALARIPGDRFGMAVSPASSGSKVCLLGGLPISALV